MPQATNVKSTHQHRRVAMTFRVVKKISLLGDSGVGKTSLIKKFVYDKFDDTYIETIGTKVSRKEVHCRTTSGDDALVLMMIWDIIGHKDPRVVPKSYYMGVSGVMVVCDITRKETFKELKFWIDRMHSVVGAKVPMVVLANKADLPDHEVTKAELDALTAETGAPWFLTSAKEGANVESAFRTIGMLVAPEEIDRSSAGVPAPQLQA